MKESFCKIRKEEIKIRKRIIGEKTRKKYKNYVKQKKQKQINKKLKQQLNDNENGNGKKKN